MPLTPRSQAMPLTPRSQAMPLTPRSQAAGGAGSEGEAAMPMAEQLCAALAQHLAMVGSVCTETQRLKAVNEQVR